jgi:hypothetical protein
LFLAACAPLASTGSPDAGGVDPAGDWSLTLDDFTVPAGAEVYRCQDFANPFGADAAFARFDSHLSAGAHHLLVFYADQAADAPLAPCSGNEFAAGPYGSQQLDDHLAYPDGVAAVVPATTGLRVQVHYLNASAQPISPHVELHLTRAAAYRDRAAVFFFSNLAIDVPAHATAFTVSKTCMVPFDVTLVRTSGHMHEHGRLFHAQTPATTLLDAATATDVAYDPPLPLTAGTPITFSCTYDNDSSAPLGYGESATTNEMCIFSGQFYPAPFGGWSCL